MVKRYINSLLDFCPLLFVNSNNNFKTIEDKGIKINENEAKYCMFKLMYSDFNFDTIIISSLTTCQFKCAQMPECTHYNWKENFCYFKRGRVTFDDAQFYPSEGYKCGIVNKTSNFNYDDI